jgi:hypothetical protein
MTTISETRISVRLQPETNKAIDKVPVGTMAEQSMNLGLVGAEPLLLAMDGLLRYAKAYSRRFEGQLAEDYVLGPEWLAAAKGIRGLLNGDGAVAMERGITTDSKSNGVIEEMFWAALGIAGFKEADL